MSIKEKIRFSNTEGAWAAAGFSLVLIIVGLPVWWWTTTVYRASLPYSSIDNLASLNGYHSVQIKIVAEDSFEIKKKLDDVLESRNHYVKYLTAAHKPDKMELSFLNSEVNLQTYEQNMSLKYSHTGSLTIFFMNDKYFKSHKIYVGMKRNILVQRNVDLKFLCGVLNLMMLDPLAKDGLNRHTNSLSLPKENGTRVLRQVPTEPGYDITLTLMLPQPHLLMAEWDVEKAVKDYLEPLAKQVENIIELRIRSQVLYMTNMNVSPKWSSIYKHYSLPEAQLPLTINAIEAKLGSFVSTRPSLHFIIYIPSEHQTPLQIHSTGGVPLASNSFLVPRWGGVIIHNPPAGLLNERLRNLTVPETFEIDSRFVMSTIISQLHKLFPIPSLNPQEGLFVADRFEGSTKLLADWQLDGLARARVLSYLSNIQITLQSLCDLVGEISNMVVSDEVAGWVWSAVVDWRACLDASREGRLQEATQYCRDAFTYSDAAFFHPSMLALLYFPDNQKYAIYVPLFLPVSIPVVLSLKMIVKLFKSRYSSYKNKID